MNVLIWLPSSCNLVVVFLSLLFWLVGFVWGLWGFCGDFLFICFGLFVLWGQGLALFCFPVRARRTLQEWPITIKLLKFRNS